MKNKKTAKTRTPVNGIHADGTPEGGRWNLLHLILCILMAASLVHAQNDPLTLQQKKKMIKQISRLIEDQYVYPERGKAYAAKFLEYSLDDVYAEIEDPKQFGETVTADLQELTGDRHFGFRLIESSGLEENEQGSLHHPVRYYRLMHKEHTGLLHLEWLEGGIGYAELCRCYGGAEGLEMIELAMKFLSSADAIIFDVRDNGGGSGDLLFTLCSYFFEYPTQLNSFYTRQEDFTQDYWTEEKIAGERLLDIPVFILTSRKTFSAAESFVFDMKVRQRAVIVGDSTGGGAHSVDLFKVGDRFEIYIPTGRSFNPLTGADWEGTGVIPDVLVAAESALDTALVLAKEAAARYREKKDSKIRQAVQSMQDQLDRAEVYYADDRSGSAESLLDSVFHKGLETGLISEFFMQVLVYHYGSEQSDEMRLSIAKKYMELYPLSFRSYESVALAYMGMGDEEKATPYFKKILKLRPRHSLSLKMLAKYSR